MVGFFPTPYPDECLYSILCRYAVRSGGTKFIALSRNLFGNAKSLLPSVYLPVKLECIDSQMLNLSDITRRDIADNHTLFSYLAMTFTPNFRAEFDNLINGRTSAIDIGKVCAKKIKYVRVKYLKYCPLCAKQDIYDYGETYWHRQHQLPEMIYCLKHETRLIDSSVLLEKTANNFYPASSEVYDDCQNRNSDDFLPYKDKFLKIGRECEWLINNGLKIDWTANGYEKYQRLLRDRGLATIKGYCNDYEALNEAFYDYWGKDFIDVLFYDVYDLHFNGWRRKTNKISTQRYSPLYHILLMCFLVGSVEAFVKSNPAETPFGHPPFVCENRICPHYHKNGAKIVDMVDYGQGFTAYFECSYCGMRYKHKKSTDSREQRFIVDYGHLWLGELYRCCQDPKITNDQTMEILKCGSQTLANQKRKHGLMKPVPDYMGLEPEAYYKAKVAEVCKQYDEVTIALLDEKVPGAYCYLQKHDYEWIRSRVVFDKERSFRIERENLLTDRLREIISVFESEGYPDRQMSYEYIAKLVDSTRDELRIYRNRPQSKLQILLNSIIENRKNWRQERIANINGRCSKRDLQLLTKLREIIAVFEAEGYPDRQMSYEYIAKLVDSTPDELRRKKNQNRGIQNLLNKIIEHRGTWRKERKSKIAHSRSKYENLIRNAMKQILSNPPQQQISRNYIAQIAGLSKDIVKDSPYLSEITNSIVETKLEWQKRRFITAYHDKFIEGKPYSVLKICRAASIDYSSFMKHRKLFEEILSNNQ